MSENPVRILHQADVEAVIDAKLEDFTDSPAAPVTSTTVALEAIGNAINTTGKVAGKQVFNTTTGMPVYAVGSTAGSVWNEADGTTGHTPV